MSLQILTRNRNSKKRVLVAHVEKKKTFSVRKLSYELLTDFYVEVIVTKNVSRIFGRVKALSVLPTLLHY